MRCCAAARYKVCAILQARSVTPLAACPSVTLCWSTRPPHACMRCCNSTARKRCEGGRGCAYSLPCDVAGGAAGELLPALHHSTCSMNLGNDVPTSDSLALLLLILPPHTLPTSYQEASRQHTWCSIKQAAHQGGRACVPPCRQHLQAGAEQPHLRLQRAAGVEKE